MSKLRAATAAEAVEGLKATTAAWASAVSGVLRGNLRPEVWGPTAYLSMCERRGAAIRLRILEASAALESNGSIEIQGHSDYTPPPEEGIAAEFGTPSEGTYACTVRLSRSTPNLVGLYEFAINQTVLGNLPIDPAPTNYTFVVRLSQGNNVFRVRTHGVSFWFYSLTVFQIPELAPA